MGTKIVIIHGHTNFGMSLSEDSWRRCGEALEFTESNIVSKLICTGGIFSKDQKGVAISSAMKDWFKFRVNADETVIEEESESLTTIDNCLKVIPMLKDEKIYVVSSDYHAFRVKLIWRLIGKREIVFLGAESTNKISKEKIIVEIIGIAVALFWVIGFKWPEMYFRKKARTF